MPSLPYFSPTYFSPFYFGGLFPASTPVIPVPESVEFGDDAAYADLSDRLEAVGAFASVVFADKKRETASYGPGLLPSAIIVPLGWSESDMADPVLMVRTADFEVVINVADDSPRSRSERLAQLSAIARRAINGVDLGGGSLPALTRLIEARYDERSRHPEQGIRLVGRFAYLTE